MLYDVADTHKEYIQLQKVKDIISGFQVIRGLAEHSIVRQVGHQQYELNSGHQEQTSYLENRLLGSKD